MPLGRPVQICSECSRAPLQHITVEWQSACLPPLSYALGSARAYDRPGRRKRSRALASQAGPSCRARKAEHSFRLSCVLAGLSLAVRNRCRAVACGLG